MDATPFDDSMEVGSESHGPTRNTDDIEIDIDIFQDRITEDDNDVVVEDASVTASDQPAAAVGPPEPANDADMFDEEDPEGDINDAGYVQYHGDYYQYGDDSYNQNTYETEMEEDYEEDIDAPIPGTDAEDTTAPTTEGIYHGNNKPHQSEDNSGVGYIEDERSFEAPPAGPNQLHEPAESGQDSLTLQETEIANEDVSPETTDHDEKGEFQHVTPPADSHDQAELESYPQDPENVETELRQGTEYHPEQEELGDNVQVTYQGQDDTSELSPLHPVKVLYQENEISLFPPREGDSSETFFLNDEEVAHKDVGELFKACRLVLGEHLGEDEELVIDIPCLNLHISEVRLGILFSSKPR
jgi:hypothetical protein